MYFGCGMKIPLLRSKKSLYTLLRAGGHGILMLFIAYWWLNLPHGWEDESKFVQAMGITKNIALHQRDLTISKDSVVFINVSYDKIMFDRLDENGVPDGQEAITDRQKLAELLHFLGTEVKTRFVILDIVMEAETPYDSVLQSAITKVPHIILPYHYDKPYYLRTDSSQKMQDKFQAWKGLADYTSDFGAFFKYTYLQKGDATVPLRLADSLNGLYIRKWGPFYYSNKGLCLNSCILDHPINQYQIFTDDTLGYPSLDLHDFVSVPPPLRKDLFGSLFQNRMVVIGDFLDRDIHQTIYGNMAGPLIQLNAYLEFKNGIHELPLMLILMLWVIFSYISYLVFEGNPMDRIVFWQRLKAGPFSIFISVLEYATLLILSSFIFYFMFGKHLNLLILALYLTLLENGIKLVKYIREKKNTSAHSAVPSNNE